MLPGTNAWFGPTPRRLFEKPHCRSFRWISEPYCEAWTPARNHGFRTKQPKLAGVMAHIASARGAGRDCLRLFIWIELYFGAPTLGAVTSRMPLSMGRSHFVYIDRGGQIQLPEERFPGEFAEMNVFAVVLVGVR